MAKQVSIFVENKKGSLTDISKMIYDAGINIFSFSLADTVDFGVFRVIVDKPEKTVSLLEENKISSSLTDVIILEIDNKPGSLYKILDLVDHLDIQYLYMFSNREDLSGVVLKISQKEEAEEIFTNNGIKIFDNKEL